MVLHQDRALLPETRRLDSLTGARFVAALGVFLFHAYGVTDRTGVLGTSLAILGQSGSVGVAFFFALSGFVLAWSWRPGDTPRAFLRRRFARLAPAYWAALLYGLVWVSILYREPLTAAVNALPAVVGLQAWFVDPDIHFAANGVEWSVSAEMFFYALFPLVIASILSRRRRVLVVAVAVSLGFVAPYLLAHTLDEGAFRNWLLDISPALRVGEFLCGALLGVAMRRGLRTRVTPPVAAALFFASYFLLPFAPSWFPNKAVLLAAILLVIMSLAQRDITSASEGGRRGLLATRVPRVLGEWSYCFYLVHQVTLQILLFVCAAVVPGRVVGPVWLMAALLSSVGLAGLLHVFVERPFERRLRTGRKGREHSDRPSEVLVLSAPVDHGRNASAEPGRRASSSRIRDSAADRESATPILG